jgi:hypothetical protein
MCISEGYRIIRPMVGSSDPALTLSTKSSPEFPVPDHPAMGRIIRQSTEGFKHIGRIIRPMAGSPTQGGGEQPGSPDHLAWGRGHWLVGRIIRPRAGSSDPDEFGRKVFSIKYFISNWITLTTWINRQHPPYSTVVLYSTSKWKFELNHQWTPPPYIFELGTFFSSSS